MISLHCNDVMLWRRLVDSTQEEKTPKMFRISWGGASAPSAPSCVRPTMLLFVTLFLLCKWTRYCSADKWRNGPWQERSRVPGTKFPGNERSRERMVLAGKGLQCLFVLGNECSREQIVLRTNIQHSWKDVQTGSLVRGQSMTTVGDLQKLRAEAHNGESSES